MQSIAIENRLKIIRKTNLVGEFRANLIYSLHINRIIVEFGVLKLQTTVYNVNIEFYV